MRIVFMGTPPFAVPSLTALVRAGHDVVAAYCQPPRPAGRGKGERKTAVHLTAEALGIPVRTPKTLRDADAEAEFAALAPDLAVVAAYGQILPRAILEIPKGGCVNVHASLLPRWRGAAPIQRAILAGDDVTGVTIMKMDEGLDTGPMMLKRELPMGSKNGLQLMEELAHLGADALIEWIDKPGPATPQPDEGITYAPKVTKAETRIDWSKPAADVVRQVRAFGPAPGAWFEYEGERIKILKASAVVGAAGNPGEVMNDELAIACAKGCVQPMWLQRASRRPMPLGEFLRGFPIPKGAILQ